jgi:hypothetical protein
MNTEGEADNGIVTFQKEKRHSQPSRTPQASFELPKNTGPKS